MNLKEEQIILLAKQLKIPTFATYQQVIRTLNPIPFE